mmetsp:Transcript_12167/g.30637  ORF Transcript_12167/g.30637 Transcript_12167/m.30637 type:complete len:355 (+) Transcript_12167:440-1504(+)
MERSKLSGVLRCLRIREPASCKGRSELAMLIHAHPRPPPLLKGDAAIPVLLHGASDPTGHIGWAMLPHVRLHLIRGHEFHLLLRLVGHEGPNCVLEKGRHSRHVDDDHLVHPLSEVAFRHLQNGHQRRWIPIQPDHHAVQVPDVRRCLHASWHVVDGSQHGDDHEVHALAQWQKLVPHTHVEHGALLEVGTDDPVIACLRALARGQQLPVLLPPEKRLLQLLGALGHVVRIFPKEPTAEGLVTVGLGEVAELTQQHAWHQKIHQTADLLVLVRAERLGDPLQGQTLRMAAKLLDQGSPLRGAPAGCHFSINFAVVGRLVLLGGAAAKGETVGRPHGQGSGPEVELAARLLRLRL